MKSPRAPPISEISWNPWSKNKKKKKNQSKLFTNEYQRKREGDLRKQLPLKGLGLWFLKGLLKFTSTCTCI